MQGMSRAIFFLALATFFLLYALNMEPRWGRTMLFAFAGIDYAWGLSLLIYSLKKRKK